ncbi:GntR family transcriptional regulator [Bacillus daqingensis]|uniref:GntR family transcriptional regulator n=1 Tax=Bacillus daqingensis TaxID=872396 RepID=A0ABV9NT97_9BACI
MSGSLDDSRPIFLQIKERLADQIVNQQLKEHDQVPSTNKLVQFYRVNHLTVAKGVNQLVEEGILYKKRGVGMFVEEGARSRLLQQRKQAFQDAFIEPMIKEADMLGLSEQELLELIRQGWGGGAR